MTPPPAISCLTPWLLEAGLSPPYPSIRLITPHTPTPAPMAVTTVASGFGLQKGTGRGCTPGSCFVCAAHRRHEPPFWGAPGGIYPPALSFPPLSSERKRCPGRAGPLPRRRPREGVPRRMAGDHRSPLRRRRGMAVTARRAGAPWGDPPLADYFPTNLWASLTARSTALRMFW